MANEKTASVFDHEWLNTPSLQILMVLLNSDGAKARIAGGAVRNALLGADIADIDIATTLQPDAVMKRLKDADIKYVPTGVEFGTVTAVIDTIAYEITTLREDVETDGRHARVAFGTDWMRDARRRDLTINALYMDGDGTLFDPLGGLDDVLAQRVRFIDDAEKRIQEDYLRILRFFRFFAWYGAHRPDAEGLKACARLKEGLLTLSSERVWQELSKLFNAPDPARAVLWMRQAGVLSIIVPESEKWGIDFLSPLIAAEKHENWSRDMLLRLMAIIPPVPERLTALCQRLKTPNRVKKRLLSWADMQLPRPDIQQEDFQKWLFEKDKQAVRDRLRLFIIKAYAFDGSGAGSDRMKDSLREKEMNQRRQQLEWLENWREPVFPLKGKDMLAKGITPGPEIAHQLAQLKKRWVESHFTLSKQTLLDHM